MPDITNATDVAALDLSDLRRLSSQALFQLSESLTVRWHDEMRRFLRRSEQNRASTLVDEFMAPLCGHVSQLHYELAFVPGWCDDEETKPLYQVRWWICEFMAGVYFIYDQSDALQYVGSCCGGALGCRIYKKVHEPYRRAVDIVLFDRQWCHLALAFEALAISRLKPPKNKEFCDLWIQPVSPFDKVWRRP